MAQANEIEAAGAPALLARLLGSTVPLTGLTATGTIIADAYALTSGAFAEFTTVGSGTGALLPPAGGSAPIIIFNGGSNALTIYPQSGNYMNGTVDATFSVTNAKSAIFWPSGTRWIANLSS